MFLILQQVQHSQVSTCVLWAATNGNQGRRRPCVGLERSTGAPARLEITRTPDRPPRSSYVMSTADFIQPGLLHMHAVIELKSSESIMSQSRKNCSVGALIPKRLYHDCLCVLLRGRDLGSLFMRLSIREEGYPRSVKRKH